MRKPRAWLCWSSGKDSAWALHTVREEEVDVVGLLTTVTEPYDRVSMHGVRTELLEAQARAVGLPLHCVSLPATCSNEISITNHEGHEVHEDQMLCALGALCG